MHIGILGGGKKADDRKVLVLDCGGFITMNLLTFIELYIYIK